MEEQVRSEACDGESQNTFENTDVTRISDDQKLFLKVLENLKNAVRSKPDNKSLALPKIGPSPTPVPSSSSSSSSSRISDITGISRLESHTSRSEPEEPGTTTVTVSNKTKSLILQKLAVANDIDKAKLQGSYNSFIISNNDKDHQEHNKSSSDTSRIAETVKVSVSTNDIKRVNDKDTLNVKIVNKENVEKASSTVGPKICRLIAPATPTVQLYTCNSCDYYSENKNYLKQHIDLVHNPERPFKCPYCDYAGKRSHALREHLIVHTNERPFQCKSCNATFRKKGHLTNHIKLHNSKRLVKCPLCKVLVYDIGENGLDAHLKNDHDTERLYGCDLCDHIAANEPDILKHLNDKHKSKISLHKCEKCPFQTANTIDFEGHVQAHNITESKVQIKNSAPTEVVGVVTVPKDSQNLGVPNSTVKLRVEEDKAQPAVIKPVWIKCSECGFTGQDSEVIRKHMLEHLREQYGDEIPPSEQQAQASAKPAPDGQSSAVKVKNFSTPILVPVTKSMTMSAPVLVPATDTSMLKSLCSVPVSALQLASSSVSTVNLATEIPRDAMKNVNNSKIVTLVPHITKAKPIVTSTQLPTGAMPVGLVAQKVLPEQISKSVAIQIPANSIPLNSSAASTTGVKVIPVQLDGTSMQGATSSIVSTVQSKPYLPVTLTEMPAPRSVSIPEIPKIQPEILQLSTAVAKTGGQPPKVQTQKQGYVFDHQNIEALRESIANVQKLIDQQDELHKQTGNTSIVKIDAKGIPEKVDGQKVIYYMTPVGKHNTVRNKTEAGFTHDNSAGRFRCTLCGYTCEYQRTIKAHIWKHSGNKDIYYPMFQNGPLSIYEDSHMGGAEPEESIIEMTEEVENESPAIAPAAAVAAAPLQGFKVVSEEVNTVDGKKPSFIVYEQTKISNVAPALAHLIAARTMVGLKDSYNNDDKAGSTENGGKDGNSVAKFNENIKVCVADDIFPMIKMYEDETKKRPFLATVGEIKTSQNAPVSANVIVESVNSISTTGFTGLNSQQSSPRVTPAPKSPDSGLSEQTLATKTVEELSVSSGFISHLPNFEFIAEEIVNTSNDGQESEVVVSQNYINNANQIGSDEGPPEKKARVSSHEDSAVTLLSLLKKGPNYNPACPPKPDVVQAGASDGAQVHSPGQEDSNSMSETDPSGSKPKSGISTSLLAVIEQLRERSKVEPDEEKVPTSMKKQSRRRSRKSSLEDSAPAAGIDNVEEFVSEGVVKFRCKLCHYTNDSTMLLRQHMRLHKPKQEFECSLCEHIAESSEALQDHMIQHCKVRTYQCKLCNSAFNYKSQLRAHMRMHNDQDILLCDFCDFETRSASALKAHTKSHLTKPPYKCELCKEEFITSFNLRIHKREGCYTSIDKGGNFKCDECEFVSTSRREMKNHQRVHMGKSTIPTKKRCPYCDVMAMTIEQIQQHIADVHGESKPLKCEMCGFIAVSIRSLKSHMKRHVNDQRFVAQPLEQYKCNLCGYVCHHLPSLKSHMWRHAADAHYSYEFTNDVINAAIDFDSQTEAVDTTSSDVDTFKKFIFDKMKAKGLENTRSTEEESALACCWVTFRCCQCGFETINKAELNMHMAAHSDVIKWTLDVSEDDSINRKQVAQILHG